MLENCNFSEIIVWHFYTQLQHPHLKVWFEWLTFIFRMKAIVSCENCFHIFALQEKSTTSWYKNSQSVFRSSRTTSKTSRRAASVWPRWLLIRFPWRWHDYPRRYGRNGWFKVQKPPVDRLWSHTQNWLTVVSKNTFHASLIISPHYFQHLN